MIVFNMFNTTEPARPPQPEEKPSSEPMETDKPEPKPEPEFDSSVKKVRLMATACSVPVRPGDKLIQLTSGHV